MPRPKPGQVCGPLTFRLLHPTADVMRGAQRPAKVFQGAGYVRPAECCQKPDSHRARMIVHKNIRVAIVRQIDTIVRQIKMLGRVQAYEHPQPKCRAGKMAGIQTKPCGRGKEPAGSESLCRPELFSAVG